MTTDSRAGRPRASSRETLAEAACELFLEQGYEATSVADITNRAGVSRSSFFNYFSSKSDVLWSGLDRRIENAIAELRDLEGRGTGEAVRQILHGVVRGFEPDPLALALRNSRAMGLGDEMVVDAGTRHARLAAAIAEVATAAGIDPLAADILGSAHAAAVLSSLRVWAEQGAGRGSPEAVLYESLRVIHALPWGE